MASQVIYQTNADWTLSYEAMANNPLVITYMTQKGLLQFNFTGSHTIFQLSAEGKLQVRWTDVSEKRTLFRLLKNLLIPKPNEKLSIKPLKQQTWIEYPTPNFKLYWCDTETEYTLKNLTNAREPTGKTIYSRIEEISAEHTKILKAIDELRHQFRFFREPTKNEVALKSGCLKSECLDTALLLSRCKPASNESARWLAEKAINLAGWLLLKENKQLNPQLVALTQQAVNDSSLEIVERAQVILKHYPNLVPRVNGAELTWPDETKKTWMEVFGYTPPPAQHWILWPASMLN